MRCRVNSKVTQMDTDDSERVRLSLGAVQLDTSKNPAVGAVEVSR
jgi:hypothetical protein